MKPDGGLSPGDMEDLGMEPSKFFCQLGLLIIESRVPELSTRGRTEGLHCPADVGHLPCLKHDCDTHSSRCKRAEARQKQMNLLWCNKIPMCIEVLLFPDCQHGRDKANNTDVSMPDALTDSLLLEQWTIQVIPKRCVTRLVSPLVLFQAVKSYLYFSQLSAWLNTSHGTAPKTIAYRISPPGEFCTSTFSENPEWHEFPVCCLLKSVAVKISLAAVSRRPSVPKVICSHPQHQSTTEHNKQPHYHSITEHNKQPQHQSTTEHKHPPHYSTTEHNIQPTTDCTLATVARTYCEAVASCSDGILEGATAQTPQWPLTDVQTSTPQPSTGAIPKLCHYTPVLKDHTEETSASCVRQQPSSRRVLYTKTAQGTPAYYPKDKSRTASPDIDYFVNKTLESSTELEPLSPTDVQLYLLSLGGLGHDRVDTRRSDDKGMHWPVGKKPPARTNLLRAFIDSGDRDSSHWHKFPSQTCNSPSLLQQQQQQQQQKVQQEQRAQEYNTAETYNVVSVKDYDTKTFHKDEKDTFRKGDTQVCHKGDTQVCHKGDTQVCHKGDTQVCHKGDTQVCHKGDTQVCHKGDTQVCHKGDTQVFHEGDPSARSKLEMTSDNRDDRKESSSDMTGGVTFSLGDNERVPALNGAAYNTSLECNMSPSPAKSSNNGDTLLRRPCSTSSRRPFHKSVSMPTCNAAKFPGFSKVSCLLRSVIRKEMVPEASQVKPSDGGVISGHGMSSAVPVSSGKSVPSQQDKNHFQKVVNSSSKLMFRCGVASPLQSSPAPMKKKTSGCFDFDSSLTSVRAIKNSISCVNLDKHGVLTQDDCEDGSTEHFYSASAPASTNRLLGNFEESLLNGRIEPAGVVDGFSADIGASGDFCPKHVQADVTAFFFSLSDDNAPSPYLGHISLDCAGKRGYHVPRHGTVQVTLFNPNKTVVKMFVVMYNLSDMPANSQTFLRQRTLYTPVKGGPSDQPDAPSYLRYLIHLRFMSSRTGKIYLHTDIRLIFARDKFEYDARVANYELRSFTEGPTNPEFSPKS